MDASSFQLPFANDGSFMEQFTKIQQATSVDKDRHSTGTGSAHEIPSKSQRKEEDSGKTMQTARVGGIKIKMKRSFVRGSELGLTKSSSLATNSRSLTDVFDRPEALERSESSHESSGTRRGNRVWAHGIVWFLRLRLMRL